MQIGDEGVIQCELVSSICQPPHPASSWMWQLSSITTVMYRLYPSEIGVYLSVRCPPITYGTCMNSGIILQYRKKITTTP